MKSLITKVVIKNGAGDLESRKRRAISIRKWLFAETAVPVNDELVDSISQMLPQNRHENGLSYDITIRPEAYILPYIDLARLYKQYSLRSFQALPLSTSCIPRHITIDTLILLNHVLGKTKRVTIDEESKVSYWGEVFNLSNKAFRSRRDCKFIGMIRTDGVSLCAVIGPPSTKRGTKRKRIKIGSGGNRHYSSKLTF